MSRALIVILVAAMIFLGLVVGARVYRAVHCRGGLYCGCPGVGGCNE
jgi:hypothetical protein